MKNLILRPEQPGRYHDMEELVREAFWDRFSPGCSEHLVVHDLRTSASAVPELCLAAELDGELAGGIWYARAALRHPDGSETPVLTMGPVAVRPDLQGQGIGSELIRRTLRSAAGRACAVIIYGNPAYYRRFGFRSASEFGITDSSGSECPAILVFPMGEVPSGAFDEGPVYQVTPEKVRAFDRTFPHRQKHLRSGQLFWVPPGPPPEDPLLKKSRELRDCASRFLKSSGILEAWESIGGAVRCVGSYRSDLMMKDRDIDLHIYTETLDPAQSLNALRALACSPRTRKLTYINGAATDEHCLEWHLQMADADGELWTVDMIQILAGSRLDGFFEDTTEAIIDALTPETRRRILELKAAAPDDAKICGIEFYQAVLAGSVTNWDEFQQWRRHRSPESLFNWRP
ncbi:MAG: N-acetyltransferase [Lentisphaeria bacterium]|nr:N-acetyltransferase [Lentisphaeria bacterium]